MVRGRKETRGWSATADNCRHSPTGDHDGEGGLREPSVAAPLPTSTLKVGGGGRKGKVAPAQPSACITPRMKVALIAVTRAAMVRIMPVVR